MSKPPEWVPSRKRGRQRKRPAGGGGGGGGPGPGPKRWRAAPEPQASLRPPPLGRVKHIQCSMMTTESILAQSVLEVNTTSDLSSNKLGVSALEKACETCDNVMENCPGHMGHIRLPVPVFRVLFVKRLISILNCVCLYCQRPRLPRADPNYDFVMNHLQPTERLAYLEKASQLYRRCGQQPKLPRDADAKKPSRKRKAEAHATDSDDEAEDDLVQVEKTRWNTPSEALEGEPCGQLFVKFRNEDRDNTFVRAVVVLDEKDRADYEQDRAGWTPFGVTPELILGCLKELSPETKTLLGCGPFNDPVAHMWEVLPVPSLNTRPAHTFRGIGHGKNKKHAFGDWTKFYTSILKFRNTLQTLRSASTEQISCCHYKYRSVESLDWRECFRVAALDKEAREAVKKKLKKKALQKSAVGAVEAAWRNLTFQIAAFHSPRHKKCRPNKDYGKPPKNVMDPFMGQKSAQFRNNIIARRVNNAGRAVLEGCIFQPLDQAGLPRILCMNLSVKTYVNALNLAQAQRWILNGPFRYPGANYVTLKNGDELNLAFYENRRDIRPEDVLCVRRHVLDGDTVLVGRQPTLHRPSMMSFRVKVHDEYVIRLHYAVFPPMAADCDGDEVTVNVPQTIESIAEARNLCSVGQNVMKDGKVWIKFIQNAVVGAYLMTEPGRVFTREQATQLVQGLEDVWGLGPPAVWRRGEPRWTGHQLISLILPPTFCLQTADLDIRHGQFLRGRLNDQALNGAQGLLNHLYRDYGNPQITLRFLHHAYLLWQAFLDRFGHSAGFYDCAVDPRHREVRTGALGAHMDNLRRVQAYADRLERYSDTLTGYAPDQGDQIVEANLRTHIDRVTHQSRVAINNYHKYLNQRGGQRNGVLTMIESGAKGSPSTLDQMCGMVGQIYVIYERCAFRSSHFLQHQDTLRTFGFVRGSFSEGLPLTSVVSQAPATCEAVVGKNKGTSKSGYTTRKLTTCMMGIKTDHWHRAVDTRRRVIWNKYGNDGFDPQRLTRVRVPLLTREDADLVRAVSTQGAEAVMTDGARANWRVAPGLAVMQSELATLRHLRQELLDLQARAQRAGAVRDFRISAPFDVDHVCRRCPGPLPSRVDLTPPDYVHFVRGFWARAVQERLVPGHHTAWKAVLFEALTARRLMLRWRFGAAQLRWLAREMLAYLRRSQVLPGEAVGITATQNMGEPYAQMSLHAPHHSGKFSGVVEGTVRIANIVDGSFRDPQMTVALKTSQVRSREDAVVFGSSLVRTYLKDVMVEPATYAFEGQGPARQCVIHLPVARSRAVERCVSLRAAVKMFCRASPTLRLDQFHVTPMHSPEWAIRLRVGLQSDFWKLVTTGINQPWANDVIVAQTVTHNLTHSVVVHGVPEVTDFIVEPLSRGEPGQWSVVTLGSNLTRVLRHEWVDPNRSFSNDVVEMSQVFGLFAARKALENEFRRVLAGMLDDRHIRLISRMMVSDCAVKGMKTKKMGQVIPPLQRAAFEQAPKQMSQNCAVGARDYGDTVCGAALANKRLSVGTGFGFGLRHPPVRAPYPLQQAHDRRPDRLCPYVFSPKADGVRYFLGFFHTRDKEERVMALVDREFQVHTMPPTDRVPAEMFQGTLLDGELTELADGQIVFLVFDCLMVCGNRTSNLRYDQRLDLAREVMHRATTHNTEHPPDWAHPAPLDLGDTLPYAWPASLPERQYLSHRVVRLGPLACALKPVFQLEGLQRFAATQSLPFRQDGYVFTRLHDPAYPFRQNPTGVFKWKPNQHGPYSEHTLDFVVTTSPTHFRQPWKPLHQTFSRDPRSRRPWTFALPMHRVEGFRQPRGQVWLWVPFGRRGNAFCFSAGFFRDDLAPKFVPGSVWECQWSHLQQRWVLARPRKKKANSWPTVVATLLNIVENIQLHEVVTAAHPSPLPPPASTPPEEYVPE